MKSPFYLKIVLRQWSLLTIAGCLIAVALLKAVYFPLAQKVCFELAKVNKNYSFVSKADSIAQMVEIAKVKADCLDSIIASIVDTQSVSEQAVPAAVYSLANISGIKASKVEIANKVAAPIGFRIPVSVKAEGPYGACGKFIEGIEKMKPAGRILDLNLKSAGSDRISMSVNFVIVSQ